MKHNTFISVQEKIVEKLEQDIIEATIKVNTLIEQKTKASTNLNSNNRYKNPNYNLISICFSKSIDEAIENLNYIVSKCREANKRLQELIAETNEEATNEDN